MEKQNLEKKVKGGIIESLIVDAVWLGSILTLSFGLQAGINYVSTGTIDPVKAEVIRLDRELEKNKPEIKLPNNQRLVYDNYGQRNLLTDIDYDGSPDLNEVSGGTPGAAWLIYKKGFGPAQSVDLPVEVKDAEYFQQYEHLFK